MTGIQCQIPRLEGREIDVGIDREVLRDETTYIESLMSTIIAPVPAAP